MNKKPVNIDEQRTEALAASLSSTGLDAFSISRFLVKRKPHAMRVVQESL